MSRKNYSSRKMQPIKRRQKTKRHDWEDLSPEELLDVKICDLGLKIEGTSLEPRIERLYNELELRELDFRPHCWLSEEWFSPDGIPGIAIPFYLAHPRLMRLERRMMMEVEGGTEDWCMKILRHECGHAIDNAYGLHRKRSWTNTFGKYSQPYPENYQPKPYSKSYVLHLDPFYAQSHPAEDFAETFAVWLKPRSAWRKHYAGWAALKKLEYVEELMAEVPYMETVSRTKMRIDSLPRLKKTLRDHYEERQAKYLGESPIDDDALLQLFTDDPKRRTMTAAAFFIKHKAEIRQVVSEWSGQYKYTIDQVLKDLIFRCRELDLRLKFSERDTKRDALVLLAVQTMNYLHRGFNRYQL
ncbi:MAG: putative zinc-binding metallopeptidase [Planctomycetaceae bacterium]|jgi:hypothetical protein|nr:putative zinc-binding metallopeptidase [Planctomycetaceae bacterium]MDG2391512.1 putative zinc-binding metallopeptidase [Planctomycetaceae bacterium]